MFATNHWNELLRFQSAEYTQAYLNKCYRQIDCGDASVKSYENCYPFMYYLQHAEIYYRQANEAPVSIQPVLLFYGFAHLMKACLLTADPLYPETTAVLAHGVTSRKKKKQNYRFSQDEVKIQKMGLCAHIANKLFHLQPLEGDKYAMHSLLEQVPELDLVFPHRQNFIFVEEDHGKYMIPFTILDHYHMTAARFSLFLEQKLRNQLSGLKIEEQAISFSAGHLLTTPFRFHYFKNKFCLPVRLNRELRLPDMLIHYLLLYNLSMISRYETEWWAEFLKERENSDFPAIHLFLQTTLQKGPFMCLQFLSSRDFPPAISAET
ncbi:YaaC family protein [Heyndrickxia acidiproducens]|uniref:YaaC family protein n=1 Tax=Heyndrickxia acidiproducens TaxID=1121084 RepID=UPI000372F3C8|nr:YaaC family protein [Heyndrickxia acidiproducens]